MSAEPSPAGQESYQIRFDWGLDGAETVGREADAIVWVSQLAGVPGPSHSVAGSLEEAAAIGAWALQRQEELGGRFRVAVVAAGAARSDGSRRWAVEDFLAAGAIIEEIAARGIDHQSPEAAAAAAAYRGLAGSTRHLLSACVTARESREGLRGSP